MILTQEQKENFNKMIDCRDNIVDNLSHIQHILRQYFPEEFEIAYQFWIPQIITALYNDSKWLNRGEKNMQNTIDRIIDKVSNNDPKGVSKYIQ